MDQRNKQDEKTNPAEGMDACLLWVLCVVK
jgi:hypothetical protein